MDVGLVGVSVRRDIRHGLWDPGTDRLLLLLSRCFNFTNRENAEGSEFLRSGVEK